MSGEIEALLGNVVRKARRAGADEAEAYFERRNTTLIEVRDGEVETLSAARGRGMALRVLVAGAGATVYSSVLEPRELSDLARRAVTLAREATPDPHRHLPDPAPVRDDTDLGLDDRALREASTEHKVDLLRRMEGASREADARVHSTELARYWDVSATVALANSRGQVSSFQRTAASLVLTVVGRQDGQALSGYGFSAGTGLVDLNPEQAGQMAARRACAPLGGQPVETQRATVVMEPEVAAGLLGQLALALSGDAVLKGRSMFIGRLGQQVGSGLVTLVDHGDLPGGLASAPFDGEGVPTGRTVLVERGELRGYLHSVYTARRLGHQSTGNAVRQSFRQHPEISPTNFALLGPATPRADLIGGIERGLLVLTTRNVGGINPVNGDYSVGAAGIWIERGEAAGPVSGVTIAANMADMLSGLTAIGDDFRWSPVGGVAGSGSLRFEGMTIGGH